MSKIHSTIGDSNFARTGNRHFVVGEESQVPEPVSIPSSNSISPEMVSNLRRQAQDNRVQSEQRNLGEARRRIEIITGLGRRTKDVPLEVDGGTVIFTLRTLKTFEQNCLAQVIEQSERMTTGDGRVIFSPTSISKLRIEALSHSLFLIDGQSIDIILGTANADYDTQVIERKGLIEEMDHALINYLYNNYEILTQETYDGYIPKTVAEAKEVVETISKSGQDT
jgi:hypothetical protein